MNRPGEPRTVTSPVSGKRVRIPVLTVLANGERLDLFHITLAHLRAYDAQLTGVENGCVSTDMAKGRLGRFETTVITRREEQFTGQAPAQKQSA